jgi:hypothetical protein
MMRSVWKQNDHRQTTTNIQTKNRARSRESTRKSSSPLRVRISEIDEPCPLLSCAGLTLRDHELISTPTMGLRTNLDPPKLPLPEWKNPISTIEYLHMRPFESNFFGKEKPMYLIGGKRPNTIGHFVEVSNVYTKYHAQQELDQLKQHPSQPTEWAKKVHFFFLFPKPTHHSQTNKIKSGSIDCIALDFIKMYIYLYLCYYLLK